MDKWHKGPPPEIGWWPASVGKNIEVIRWWDGEYWSYPCDATDSAEYAGIQATLKEIEYTTVIRWTQRWWEGV